MMERRRREKAIVWNFGGVRDLMEEGKEEAGGGDAGFEFYE